MNFLAQQAETEILKLHNEFESMLQSSMGKAMQIGERLTEAQEEMSGGEYKKWVEEKLPFSMRSAQRYKRAFTHRKTLETTAVSQLAKGLDSIKTPKEPKAVEPKPVENTNNKSSSFGAEALEPLTERVQEIMNTDAGGMVIPENLADIFKDARLIKTIIDDLRNIKKHVLTMASENPLYRYLKINPFEIDIDNTIRALKHALPYAVCRFCSGTGNGVKIDEKCACCKGAGFVNKAMYEATPPELK